MGTASFVCEKGGGCGAAIYGQIAVVIGLI
jgi:hypothetical protein